MTLLEVLLVLVLLAITVSMAVVAIRDWSSHHRLDDAAARVVQAIRFVQGQALVTGEDAGVEFDKDNGTLRCVKVVGTPPYAELNDPLTKRPYVVDLAGGADSAGVQIASATFGGGSRVSFGASGAPQQPGTVVLSYSGANRTITVAPVSGAVDVQ
jgi:type II secretory pathway pseudopilin PulG